MIKFFRKIRYELMEKNKTGKYFKYAIGEIVLVVIGILIAIQLNEWQNDNSKHKQKQKVLTALKLEFQSNLTQLDTVLYYISKVQKAVPKANAIIDSQDGIMDNDVFYKPLIDLGYTWSYNPINGALRSGISSGEIHLLNNDRLIELLFSWEDVVKDSEEEAIRLRSYQSLSWPLLEKYVRSREVWKSVISQGKGSKHLSDFTGLYKDPLFEDYVTRSGFWAREYITELNIIRTNNLEILALIDKELLK